jgi:hypothetical protein
MSFTLKMEATRSSETSVYNNPTRLHIPEDGILHTSMFIQFFVALKRTVRTARRSENRNVASVQGRFLLRQFEGEGRGGEGACNRSGTLCPAAGNLQNEAPLQLIHISDNPDRNIKLLFIAEQK